MPQTHVNISEIITSVESGILSSHGEVENPDLLRGEIAKSILDYKPSLSLTTQSKEEIKILWNLKKDKNTVITRVDKGNTVVIMDSADYQNKMNTLLLDKNTYKEIKTHPTDKYTKQLRKELEILKDNRLITPQMYRKFYPKVCSAPNFYGLPKIHKKDTFLVSFFLSYSSLKKVRFCCCFFSVSFFFFFLFSILFFLALRTTWQRSLSKYLLVFHILLLADNILVFHLFDFCLFIYYFFSCFHMSCIASMVSERIYLKTFPLRQWRGHVCDVWGSCYTKRHRYWVFQLLRTKCLSQHSDRTISEKRGGGGAWLPYNF